MKKLLLLVATLYLPSLAWADYTATVLADSPRFYYHLNESSGTTATDSSGQSNNGTYSASGWTYNQTGLLAYSSDTAVKGSGSSGVSITQTSVATCNGTTNGTTLVVAGNCNTFAAEIILKPTSIRDQAIITDCNTSACTSGWVSRLWMDSSGHFVHDDYNGSGTTNTGTTVATAGTTYHVIVHTIGTNDVGAAPNQRNARLFVNGVKEGGNSTFAFDGLYGGGIWSILHENGGHSNAGAFTIDELSLYAGDYTVTMLDARITAHYKCARLGISCNGTNPGVGTGIPFSVKRQEFPSYPNREFFVRLLYPTWLDYSLGVRFQSPLGDLALQKK